MLKVFQIFQNLAAGMIQCSQFGLPKPQISLAHLNNWNSCKVLSQPFAGKTRVVCWTLHKRTHAETQGGLWLLLSEYVLNCFSRDDNEAEAYTAEGWSKIPFANCKTKMPLHLGVDKSFRSIAFAGDWTATWHQSLRLLCWNTCRYWYYPWQIPWQNLTVSMQRIIGIKFQVCQEVICKQEGQAKARASAVLLRVPIKTSQTNWHLSIHPPSQKINCSRGRGEIAGCTFFYGLRKARAKINQGHKVHVPPNAVWQSEESLPAGAMSQSRIHHL